jgi:hypothetical protein
MATKKWEVVQVRYCDHAGCQVALQAEKLYPADHLPDQAPRVMAQRCSHSIRCMLENRPSCVWAGSNPNFDPFLEES